MSLCLMSVVFYEVLEARRRTYPLGEIFPGIIVVGGEAGLEVLATDNIVRRAGGHEGRVVGISTGEGVDVETRGEVDEHGARVAGLEVEDEVLVHVLVVHFLDGGDELRLLEVVINDDADTWTTVIHVVDEDVILLGGLEDLGVLKTVALLDGILLTGENVQQEIGVDVGGVIDVVDALTVVLAHLGLVGSGEDLTGVGVSLIIEVAGVGEVDDVVLGDAVSLGKLRGGGGG